MTARPRDRIRAVLAEQGEGLASLCFRTATLRKMHRRLDRLTLKPEPVADVESRDDTSGARMSWKRTRTATDATRGVRMFFLELSRRAAALGRSRADAPITAMDHVVVSTADPERAAALYGARLGLDMALDRSHPEWGRLMFFRCGDLIVEVTSKPGKADETKPDRLRGICWRVARYRRHPCAACSCWRRRFRSAYRPQAGHAGDDGAQRHLWCADATGAACAEARDGGIIRRGAG